MPVVSYIAIPLNCLTTGEQLRIVFYITINFSQQSISPKLAPNILHPVLFQMTHVDILIYTHVVQDDFTSEFSEFVRRISEFLIPKIIEENSLIVRRIGIIFTCEISDHGIQSFAEKYFKPEFKEVTDFRFSKKESTVSGAIWSDKSDFINKIYTVGAIGENLTGISFDYQAHYVPPRTYVSDVIKPVLERGKQLLSEEVLTAGEKNGKK